MKHSGKKRLRNSTSGKKAFGVRNASDRAIPIHVNSITDTVEKDELGIEHKVTNVNKSTYNVGANATKRRLRKPYGMPKKVWEAMQK
jgi:hypothetical protein